MGNEGDDEEDDARAEKTKKPPWPPRSVSTEASNDETPAGHSLYPLVAVDCITDWSTAAPTETKNHNQGHHGNHHSRATTTTAQHSGGPCSSTSWNLGRKVWRADFKSSRNTKPTAVHGTLPVDYQLILICGIGFIGPPQPPTWALQPGGLK
uniref:Uncharacterized protein n=1 Tax=Fagus sylvatica TaxID=28930 RepID=A0A2N9E2L9_FAGSY